MDGGERDDGIAGGMANNVEEETKADPAMPLPLPDLMLGSADVLIFKYIGVAGVIFSLIIFCSQVRLLKYYILWHFLHPNYSELLIHFAFLMANPNFISFLVFCRQPC